MSTNVTWNGTTYSIPAAGEVGWSALSNFLIALGNGAAVAEEMKQAVRVATTSPVTVSDTTDCVIVTKLSVAGAVTVNLPAGSTGRIFFIVDGTGDAATNNVTIDGNLTETINGSSTYVIRDNYGGVAIAWNGTQWNVIGRYLAGALLSNPMDSTGDMIYGGAAGTPTKLDSGSSGQLLMSNGAAAPGWVDTVSGAKTFSGIMTLSQSSAAYTLNINAADGYGLKCVTSDASGQTAYFTFGGSRSSNGNLAGIDFVNMFTGSAVSVAGITATRDGANNSGKLNFSTRDLGSATDWMSISASGVVTIGSGSSVTHAVNGLTRTTVGVAGAASALPANPVGYLVLAINGANYQLPYYNTP